MVREKNPFILCLQETKLSVFDDAVCKSIWSDINVNYSFQPSRGTSGGLVTLWDCTKVEVWVLISAQKRSNSCVSLGILVICFTSY